MAGQPGGAPKEQILKGVVRRKNVVLGDDLARMREQHAHLFRQKEAAPQIAPLRNGGAIGRRWAPLQRRLYGLQKGQGDVVAEAQRATPHVPAPLKADVPVPGDAGAYGKAASARRPTAGRKIWDNLKLIAHEVQDAGNTGKPEKEAPRSLPQGDGVPGQAERPLQFLVLVETIPGRRRAASLSEAGQRKSWCSQTVIWTMTRLKRRPRETARRPHAP